MRHSWEISSTRELKKSARVSCGNTGEVQRFARYATCTPSSLYSGAESEYWL